MAGLTDEQRHVLEVTERVAASFSFVGCCFILLTFSLSPRFRKPVNRLIFYASWGNFLSLIAAFMSHVGIEAGATSALCQFQGFIIEFCLPSDALWNLMMAINVYLTVFKNYHSSDLKRLEWRYILTCYGVPFIVGFTLCFCSSESRGKIYGPADLWCWISPNWNFLRIVVCYGPIWICILVAFTIYVVAGREIFRKREQLRAFQGYPPAVEEASIQAPCESHPTNKVHISREVAVSGKPVSSPYLAPQNSSSPIIKPPKGYEQYSVSIECGSVRSSMEHRQQPPRTPVPQVHHNHTAALAANAAAWGYTKCAILFFVSLTITWTPSSIDRTYSLTTSEVCWPLTFAAGLVLPLMGFWNGVIYTVTSWEAVMLLVRSPSGSARSRQGTGLTDTASIKMTLTPGSTDGRQRLESIPSATESQECLSDHSAQELAGFPEGGKKRAKGLCSVRYGNGSL